jgi:hypothetical protein
VHCWLIWLNKGNIPVACISKIRDDESKSLSHFLSVAASEIKFRLVDALVSRNWVTSWTPEYITSQKKVILRIVVARPLYSIIAFLRGSVADDNYDRFPKDYSKA